MMDMRDNLFLQQYLFGYQAFDWLTVLALFLVGLFYLLPHLTGQTLNPRSRGCFIGATWVLVFKLFIHLVQILLIHLSMFNSVVGMGPRGGGSADMAMVVMLFFPIIEGMFFVLAVVLFVAGLPSMIQREQRWEPEPPRSEDQR